MKCRHCGCTETQACPGGCWWVRPEVCSSCADQPEPASTRERPILFSAPMVRAILDGRKTQTRRAVTAIAGFGPVSEFGHSDTPGYDWHFRDRGARWNDIRGERLVSPHGVRGDRLWVRETWGHHPDFPGAHRAVYRADRGCEHDVERWRPSIHMPRWASRIVLEITDVRVERLQDISETDAAAEGVLRDTEPCDHTRQSCEEIGCLGPTHRAAFGQLWEDLSGPGAWRANPWVWAISFRVCA